MRDLALGRDVSCARVDDHAECWGKIGLTGDGGEEEPASRTRRSSRRSWSWIAHPPAVKYPRRAARCTTGSMRVLLVIALCGCGVRDATPPAPAECPAVAPAAAAPALVRGSIAAGTHHACAIEATGRVACWGKAGNGRLGTPDRADHLTPVEVPGLDDVAGLAAGTDITCAWTAHGAVWCWGDNVEHVDAHVPRRVPHLDDIVQVVAGLFGACGLHASGRVACWPIDAWRNPLWPRV